MDATLLAAAIIAAIIAVLLLVRVSVSGFADWKPSEKIGLVQVFLPFAAAVLAINAFAGDALERPSKIGASIFTLAAGLFAIIKQVAATMEAHAGPTELVGPSVSLRAALRKLLSG